MIDRARRADCIRRRHRPAGCRRSRATARPDDRQSGSASSGTGPPAGPDRRTACRRGHTRRRVRCRVGLALCQHRHRRVIAVQTIRRQRMGRDQVVQGLQRHGAGADLVGQGHRTRPRRTRMVPAGSISAGCGCRRRSGEVGDVAGTPVPLGNSVLASGTRDCRGSEDGLAGRQIALKHGVEETDRLAEESPATRRGDPERGLGLQFNRLRNPYGVERMGRKRTLIQRVGKNT